MMKKDHVMLPWVTRLPTRYLFGERICWQPFGKYARDADLVIVMHENKLIYNLWLLSFGRPRLLAFWGHGRNMQSDRPDGLKERFKRWTTNKVDWWFAYTEESAALVADTGFPRTRTTVVENAIDTREMIELCRQAKEYGEERIRREFGLKKGPVGLYLGSLYQEKRIDFLLEAAHRIRAAIPDFQLLVVGAGPQQGMVESAANEHAWILYPGALHGMKKARALAIADLTLNPGLVGLGVLDSFVGGAPMFTTDCGLHSPEVAYLSSGRNGVITADNLDAYVEAVVSTLSDPQALAKLQEGALGMAARYTIENMVTRIANGILACLSIE
jgi:glycosyltransferase involved in cell wall biosynthesis